MSKTSESTKKAVGCLGACVGLFVLLPLWLVLLYGILSTINAPAYLWGVFYAYLPAAIIGGVVIQAAKLIGSDDE